MIFTCGVYCGLRALLYIKVPRQFIQETAKMASVKQQEEKRIKFLRRMVALPHNRHCFDCGQRGPTYVNMTIGSYVCTACSGIL